MLTSLGRNLPWNYRNGFKYCKLFSNIEGALLSILSSLLYAGKIILARCTYCKSPHKVEGQLSDERLIFLNYQEKIMALASSLLGDGFFLVSLKS